MGNHAAGQVVRVTSFARPGKLFTANQSLVAEPIGTLDKSAFNNLLEAIIHLFENNLTR